MDSSESSPKTAETRPAWHDPPFSTSGKSQGAVSPTLMSPAALALARQLLFEPLEKLCQRLLSRLVVTPFQRQRQRPLPSCVDLEGKGSCRLAEESALRLALTS